MALNFLWIWDSKFLNTRIINISANLWCFFCIISTKTFDLCNQLVPCFFCFCFKFCFSICINNFTFTNYRFFKTFSCILSLLVNFSLIASLLGWYLFILILLVIIWNVFFFIIVLFLRLIIIITCRLKCLRNIFFLIIGKNLLFLWLINLIIFIVLVGNVCFFFILKIWILFVWSLSFSGVRWYIFWLSFIILILTILIWRLWRKFWSVRFIFIFFRVVVKKIFWHNWK